MGDRYYDKERFCLDSLSFKGRESLRGCLVLDKILESYHPNRVVIQYGRVQDRPTRPIKAKFSSWQKVKAYIARYNNSPEDFNNYSSHLVSKKNRGAHATEDGQCTIEYENWYTSNALLILNHEIPTVIFQAPDNEEGHWMKKILEYTEGYVKKGLKLTKMELLNGLKNISTKLREGPCHGVKPIQIEESSGRKSKPVEETRKKKSNLGVVIRGPSSSGPLRQHGRNDDEVSYGKGKWKELYVEKEHRKSRFK